MEVNVRRALAKLRQRWEAHSPASPLCLVEEVEPGVTVSDFCVDFLLSHRSRRGGRKAAVVTPPPGAGTEAVLPTSTSAGAAPPSATG